jgi:hypothetical protein
MYSNTLYPGGIRTWGRCYDHNFRVDHDQRFTNFGRKIGAFLKNQCYDQIFAKSSLSKIRQYFRKIFGENV